MQQPNIQPKPNVQPKYDGKSLLFNQTLDEYCAEYIARHGCYLHEKGPERECGGCWAKYMAYLHSAAEGSWHEEHQKWRDYR